MDQQNPYLPPRDLSAPLAALGDHELRVAFYWQRLLTFAIDQATRYGFGFALRRTIRTLNLRGAADLFHHRGAVELFGFVSLTLYYVVLEVSTGRTLGKLVAGTRVVSLHGGRATFGQIAGRTLSRLVPLEPLSIFTRRGVWHDRWSGTRVVRTRY